MIRTTVMAVGSGDGPDATFTDRYVCPAGRTALLHTVSVANTSGQVARIIIGVRRGSTTAQVAGAIGLAHGSVVQGPPAGIVLRPGDALCTYIARSAGTTSSHTWYASGSLLEGVAV